MTCKRGMRNILLLAALAGCFSFLAWADDKPDLAGNWALNIGKSKFGKMPKPQSMTLKAVRKGDVLHSVQTTEDGQGSRSTEGDWFLDGKQHPVDTQATASKMTQMSKWDGKTLVADRKSEDGSYVENMRITVSGDGKTATEKLNVKSPNGNNTATLVWERK